jgi:hypothetical protein
VGRKAFSFFLKLLKRALFSVWLFGTQGLLCVLEGWIVLCVQFDCGPRECFCLTFKIQPERGRFKVGLNAFFFSESGVLFLVVIKRNSLPCMGKEGVVHDREMVNSGWLLASLVFVVFSLDFPLILDNSESFGFRFCGLVLRFLSLLSIWTFPFSFFFLQKRGR